MTKQKMSTIVGAFAVWTFIATLVVGGALAALAPTILMLSAAWCMVSGHCLGGN